jgi:hypothetical protein
MSDPNTNNGALQGKSIARHCSKATQSHDPEHAYTVSLHTLVRWGA